jgi:RecB family exonuclease
MTNGAEPLASVVLQPLKRLGPSRFSAFRECPLREVFRASDVPRLLAPAGAAHLGSVIHRLMEAAAGRSALTEAAAADLFDHLLAEEETRMSESPQSRAAVPLARSVADYEVRRLRAIRAAVSPETVRGATGPLQVTATAPVGSEIWVASADGGVGGFIDEACSRSGGVVLRDFKSGAAARRDSPQYRSAIVQLQLYAALYAEAWGIWPTAIEIVPVGGEPYIEQVSAEECAQLLATAKDMLRACNTAVEEMAPAEAMRQLGHPAPDVCRYCEYRPLCAPYIAARGGEGEWPRDAIGTITRRDSLRNGTLLFGLNDDETPNYVRGVSNSEMRHPALSLVQIGRRAGFFNVAGSREHHSYAESHATTIVAYDP